MAGLGDGAGDVEGEAGIGLGGDAAGDDLEDFLAEGDEDVIDDVLDLGGAGEAGVFLILNDLVEDVAVLGLLGGGVDEAGIGGGVLGLEFADGLEVAGIGDDFCELLELIELAQFAGWWRSGLPRWRWCSWSCPPLKLTKRFFHVNGF